MTMIKKLLPLLLLFHIASADTVEITGKDFNLSLDRVIRLEGHVGPRSLLQFTEQYLSSKGRPGELVIFINSSGGLERDGAQMIQMVDDEKSVGTTVICIVEKHASSMAFNLLTHCDLRLASANSRFTVHKLAMLLECPKHDDDRCTAKYLREIALQLDRDDEQYREDNAKAMGLSLEDYDVYADNETTWTAESLIELHYLDGIIQIKN